jgi:hypothetical protein
LENVTNRFARLSDILIQKIFRSIDQVMLETPGSIIDVIQRAEKRGLCDASIMRYMRELRNAIAHEYSDEDLLALFLTVNRMSDKLLDIFSKTTLFVDQLLASATLDEDASKQNP